MEELDDEQDGNQRLFNIIICLCNSIKSFYARSRIIYRRDFLCSFILDSILKLQK